DLSVEDAVRRLQTPRNRVRDSAEAIGEIVAVATDEFGLATPDVRERPVPVPLDLEEPPGAGRDVVLERGEHRVVPRRRSPLAAVGAVPPLADQQPVLRVSVELRRDERPQTPEAPPLEPHGQAPVLLLLDQLIGARVPDLDRPCAVLSLRDLALEGRVVE